MLLVSVPYAFKAHEAETLGGLPASAFVKAPSAGSAIGTYGDGTAVNALSTGGNAGRPSKGKGKNSAPTPAAICTPVPGHLILWDSQGSECPSNLFQVLTGPFTGNIGIGPIPGGPSEPLDVFGVISTYTWYGINENRIVGVHTGTGQAPAFPNTNNLFLGWLAGGNTVPLPNNGSFNTFTGFKAGFNNAPGGANTYNGTNAGFSNVTGHDNAMVGANAGFANIDSFNTCVGSNACSQHNTGGGGTYVGNAAGLNDVNGRTNSFFGDASGLNNRGDFNTFLGDRAGFNNHGSNNTFSGFSAGFNNGGTGTADNNVFYGYKAGFSNTIGIRNTYLGYQAGFNGTTGGYDGFTQGNTFVGWQAGFANVSGAGDTFVGNGAGTNTQGFGGNTFVGNAAGALAANTGKFNNFFGYYSGAYNTTGENNAFYGKYSGVNFGVGGNTTGSRNTYLGVGAGGSGVTTTGSDNIFVGYNAGGSESNVSNSIEIGNAGPSPLGSLSNTILIGTRVSHFKVFFDPILNHPTSITQVVTIDGAGQLGFNNIPGGGNVNGTCALGANFLTKWMNTTGGVECSNVYEKPTNFFVGVNLPTLNNPLGALDVNGGTSSGTNSGINTTDTRNSYMIGLNPVLSIHPAGSLNLFVGSATGSPSGMANTFVGEFAGELNTSGLGNTFVGAQAGQIGAAGQNNTFVGDTAGNLNGASANTCLGYGACANNASGSFNTYLGSGAGQGQLSGSNNTFVGDNAGNINNGGSFNIFLGRDAGKSTFSGSSDIYLGNNGCTSFGCNESNTIRIGTQGTQTATFVAGIYPNNPATGLNSYTVCIGGTGGSLGQLLFAASGTVCVPSSRRFKEGISDMGDRSSQLLQLRPVTFFYKSQYDDGSHLLQYGLIAEEVAKVYPDLVVYDKDSQALTVRYQWLTPMLLNELQKQHKVVAAQQDELQTQLQQIKTQQQQMQAQRQEIDGLKLQLQQQNASLQERLQKLESYVATQMKVASDNAPRTIPGANGGLQ